MRLALIDGDIPVYTTCFACVNETEWYKVRHTANMIIRKLLKEANASKYLGFLTHGPTNFRVKRATTWPYKGNRSTNKTKPKWFDEVRQHYIDYWKFQEMRGIEADDALTISAEALKKDYHCIICTKDKDLRQYSGEHFDMTTNKLMLISKEKAHYNLWKQVLLGDVSTDNIPGLSHSALYETRDEIHNVRVSFSDMSKSEKLKAMKRPLQEFQFGERTVEKLLDEWPPEEYASRCLNLYVDCYSEDEDPSYGEDRFYETFDLVYMLRELPESITIDFEPQEIPEGSVFIPTEFENESETDLEF